MTTTTDPKTPSPRVLYATLGMLLAILLIGAGAFMWFGGNGGGGALGIGGPFTLQDGNGKPVTDRDFRGKYMLVYFGYTFCPDVCPTTLSAVADAMDKLGPAARALTVVFITVDPQRDTPAQLKSYLSSPSFPKGIIGLTGSPSEIAAAARVYRVYYRKAGQGAGYSVDHTSIVYLMDSRGHFTRPLGFSETPEEIAGQIGAAMRGA